MARYVSALAPLTSSTPNRATYPASAAEHAANAPTTELDRRARRTLFDPRASALNLALSQFPLIRFHFRNDVSALAPHLIFASNRTS